MLISFRLKQYLIRKYEIIREGVPRAGSQELLDSIYIEPQISTCGYGGVDPSHELRPHPPSPLQVPGADTFVGLSDLFRLQKDDGQPVRTVLTTGIPGIGMSVSVGKFCLDWAELRTYKVNEQNNYFQKKSLYKPAIHFPPSTKQQTDS